MINLGGLFDELAGLLPARTQRLPKPFAVFDFNCIHSGSYS